jgi:hypothetical protein
MLLPAASGNEMSSTSFPLAAGSSICLAYAYCCMCSIELLMMGGKTVRNTQSVCKNKQFEKQVHLVGFNIGMKVKQSRYRPGVAQRVPGS